MNKTLIKNAKIYDGSGEPAFFGDVLIRYPFSPKK